MEAFRFKGIKIPSNNERLEFNPRTRKFFLSENYGKIKTLLKRICKKEKVKPPYNVKIILGTYKDIDAVIKIIFDSMEDNCIENDRDILKLEIIKLPFCKDDTDVLIVEVNNIPIDIYRAEILKRYESFYPSGNTFKKMMGKYK